MFDCKTAAVLELCLVDVAAVRVEPQDDAERITELVRGEPVRVAERRDGWARVMTLYDYPGWVREEALARRDGDPVAEARAFLGTPYLWGADVTRQPVFGATMKSARC